MRRRDDIRHLLWDMADWVRDNWPGFGSQGDLEDLACQYGIAVLDDIDKLDNLAAALEEDGES